MAKLEVKVPDIGEVESVEVIEVCVAAGDAVQQDDVLVVVESDKASMEVPAPCGGKISDVAVTIGDQVGEGTLVLTIDGEGAGAESSAAEDVAAGSSAEAPPPPASPPAPMPSPKSATPPSAANESAPASNDAQATTTAAVAPSPAATTAADVTEGVYAGPAVRRLARELGVDLAQVSATGAHGRTLKEDVQNYVRERLQSGTGTAAAASPASGTGIPAIPDQDYSKFGPIDIQPVGRILRRGGEQLHASWLNQPQVTNHIEADITELDAFRRHQSEIAAADTPKLTPLPFILKACAETLRQNPQLNGSFIEGGSKFVYKQYFHIGMAVDTADGLVVPVIKDVDKKSITTLATEVTELAIKSRDRKLQPTDMQGASFTISSLGALGGTGFTPIVNAPQVAILGVAKTDAKPVYMKSGELEKRLMMPLSLSYNHRAVNGADAGRFLVLFKSYLEDIRRLLL